MKEKRNDYFLQRGFTAQFRAAGEDGEQKGHVVEGLAAVYEQETRIADFFGICPSVPALTGISNVFK